MIISMLGAEGERGVKRAPVYPNTPTQCLKADVNLAKREGEKGKVFHPIKPASIYKLKKIPS